MRSPAGSVKRMETRFGRCCWYSPRAFALEPGVEGQVPGAWVLLVDDVVTTGSTLASCAAALLDAGALGVSAVAVARER